MHNIDYTGARTFADIAFILQGVHVSMLLTGMNRKVLKKFKANGVLKAPNVSVYDDLDRGAEFVEDLLLERAASVRKRWLLSTHFASYTRALYSKLPTKFLRLCLALSGQSFVEICRKERV